jgi:hypothetical protein
MITILFLSANPDGTDKLDLIKECNIINQKIRASAGRELFKLEQRHDISIKSLIEEILNYNPQIIHFSGHGSDKSALIFKNENTGQIEEVPPIALSNIFKVLSNKIDLVFLNACYSEKQARAIAEHVNCVIGMSDAIYDTTAIEFASIFYLSLGFKRSIKEAFDLALAQLGLLSLPGPAVPQLIVKHDIDPSKLFISKKFIPENGPNNGPLDICNLLDSLKQNHQKLLMQKITIGELFETIADPIFNSLADPNYKKKIGEVNSNALNLLFINLSSKVKEYKNLISIGNDDKARIIENQSMVIARDIIEKLDEVCK